jgi:hypothetical protein
MQEKRRPIASIFTITSQMTIGASQMTAGFIEPAAALG